MKKSIIPILAVLASVSFSAFVGCTPSHEHDYKWKSEGGEHWQECECGDKTDPEPHVDVKNNETGADGADGLCDVCKAVLHSHEYAWTNDDVEHWKVCSCGEPDTATQKGKHVDVKNNETDASGADGKCDVCAVAVFPVTFNMKGTGTAPVTQYIAKDGHAVKPTDPADEDAAKFKGWFANAACTTPFDFATAAITAPTTVYAKWQDDTTPGASKKYAHELTLDTENLKPAKVGEGVYYAFTATESGRYTISLGNGVNSGNATFTTDLTGETVYGKDCDAEEITLDIDAGYSVYILFTYKGEAGADITVSPLVTNVADEPLPNGLFKDGEYIDKNYTVTVDTATKKMTVSASGTVLAENYDAKYIGGKYQSLYIRKSSAQADEKFSLSPIGDGAYKLTIEQTNKSTNQKQTSNFTLAYVEPQEPVALAELTGYYEPKDGAYNGMLELYIYESEQNNSTSVIFKTDADSYVTYSALKSASYDTEKNRLTVGQDFLATLKLDADNNVESLLIGGKEYVKKRDVGAVPPEKLPLDNADTEFVGSVYTVRIEYGNQYFGDDYNKITVLDYDETAELYTVTAETDGEYSTYFLKVSADKKTITFYESDGTTAVDTLTKFEWVYHDLPTTEQTVSIAASDFQKGFYVYKATQDGWFNFTVPSGATVYYPLNTYDLTNTESVRTPSGSVYLKADDLAGVYMSTPAAIEITVAPEAAPVGLAEEKAKELVDGTATLDTPVDDTDPEHPTGRTFYFTFTAPVTAAYIVNATYNGQFNCRIVTAKINGTEQQGFNGNVQLEAGQELDLAIDLEYDEILNQWYYQYLTVTVVEDVSAGATDITLTGTPQGDSLTVTATVASGANRHIATSKGADVTVTGSAAFSILLKTDSGISVINAVEVSGVYTAVIEQGEDIYFKVQSAAAQNVTLTQVFEKGSMGYPLELTLTEGKAEQNITGAVCIALAPGVYSFEMSSYELYVSIGDKYISSGEPVVINEGDILACRYNFGTAKLTVTELEYVFTEEQAGTYNGTCSIEWMNDVINYTIAIDFNRFGVGTYVVDGTPFDIAIKDNKDGTYSFMYDGNAFEATFSFGDQGLQMIDEDKGGADAFTMTKQAAAQTVTYIGTSSNSDGSTSWDIKVEITGDTMVVYVDGERQPSINATTKSGNTYIVDDGFGDNFTVTIADNGETASYSYTYTSSSGTLTKQA